MLLNIYIVIFGITRNIIPDKNFFIDMFWFISIYFNDIMCSINKIMYWKCNDIYFAI